MRMAPQGRRDCAGATLVALTISKLEKVQVLRDSDSLSAIGEPLIVGQVHVAIP